jgi:hypothetical protein
MKFLRFPLVCCSRCGQPARRNEGLRSSALLPDGKVAQNLYCNNCQDEIPIGRTVRAINAQRQLWPSGQKEAA